MAKQKAKITDPDDLALADSDIRTPVAMSARFDKIINADLEYRGLDLFEIKKSTATIEEPGTIQAQDQPTLVEMTQPSYKDADLKRFEGAARRNWAIRSAIMVRQFFVFGHGSKVVVELTEEAALGMSEEEQKRIIENNKDWQKIAKDCMLRDNQVGLLNALIVFYWQALIFGRACIIKVKGDLAQTKSIKRVTVATNTVKKTLPINSRRLGEPRIDVHTRDLVAVDVDGYPVKAESLIYAPYSDLQLSPHTEFYGYSPLEPIVYAAQGLNIALEEDVPEILKSAWLASILLQINTMGLKNTTAKAKVRDIVDSIKAGKIIGVNDAVTATAIDLKPNFTGLVDIINKVEAIIYKMLSVPQFLVQNEGVANRATAIQAVQDFIDGVITADQEWLAEILEKQWYGLYVKELWQKYGFEKGFRNTVLEQRRQQVENTEAVSAAAMSDEDLLSGYDETYIPICVRRIFEQPKAAEFVDLAQAITQLVSGQIWDVQKANEILGSEEVTPRIIQQKEEAFQRQQEIFEKQGQNPDTQQKDDKNSIKQYKPAMPSRDEEDNNPET